MIYAFKKIIKNKIVYGFSLSIKDDWECFKEISEDEHLRLLNGQSNGKVIKFKDDASPFLAEYEAGNNLVEFFKEENSSKEDYNAYIDILRENAYRNESDKLGLQFIRGEVEKDIWLEKIAEIKKRYPKVE